MDIYPTAAEAIRDLHLDRPVIGVRPHAAIRAARWFVDNFPGETLYAVKANDSSAVLAALMDGGIRHFDVASISEVRKMAEFPDAILHIMHPVKSRRFIAEAYHDFGVRTFALDSEAELEKILVATGDAKDLTLVVRVASPSTYSEISLEGKFGASWSDAPALIRRARQSSELLGISFHPGSQTMCPSGYGQMLRKVSQQIVQAATLVDIIDVGGGFPARYPGMEPPALESYMEEIRHAFDKMTVGHTCQLWCEPGRALAAEFEVGRCACGRAPRRYALRQRWRLRRPLRRSPLQMGLSRARLQRRGRAYGEPVRKAFRLLRSDLRQRGLYARAVPSARYGR